MGDFVKAEAGSLWFADEYTIASKYYDPYVKRNGKEPVHVSKYGIVVFTDADVLFVILDVIPYGAPIIKLNEEAEHPMGNVFDKIMYCNDDGKTTIAWLPREISKLLLHYYENTEKEGAL